MPDRAQTLPAAPKVATQAGRPKGGKALRGPWRYLRSGYGSRKADFDIVNADGGRIASTPYEDKARLIAAAPELLAVCDAIEDHLRRGAPADDGKRIREQLHAAIAKARNA